MKPFVKIVGETGSNGEVYRTCPKCGTSKPLNDFGLRTLKKAGPGGEDVITNQSWCRPCRSPRGH